MSEKLSQSNEQEHNSEAVKESVEAKRNLERIHELAEQEKGRSHDVERLHAQAKEQSVSAKETSTADKEPKPSTSGVHKELKAASYKQTLRHVQTKLKGSDKTLSRVVHQPAVEKLSNVGAKTIARPSGVLGGGFIALLGSSALLYMSKHYGFEYNFTVFFLLFIVGFMAGVILEGLIRLIRRKRGVYSS